MSNVLATLLSSAGALSAYDQVLQVTQNNVANASTPGYVKQRQALQAMPFDPGMGSGGGVRAGEIESARNEYSEQSVRRQTVLLGQSQQNVNSLTALQSVFNISGDAGIPGALNNLFASFSAWAQSPTDSVARQQVIERANDTAAAFQQTAGVLSNLRQDTDQQLQQTVTQINGLAGQLRDYNQRVLQGSGNDAGLNAQMNAALEELSQYGEVNALWQADGTVSVLLNGETPLVLEDKQYQIRFQLSQPADAVYAARPAATILSSDGKDITDHAKAGQLGALLQMRNTTLGSYLGDAYQAGDMNTMAAQFADRVNALLTSGVIDGTAPPQPGAALFVYDPTDAAETLLVDSTVTAGSLAAMDPGPPASSNGIPLALAALATPQQPADQIQGASYNEFYGNMTARAGRALNDATGQMQAQQSAVAQAKDLRQQLSGVSLDEEAAILIQFQRGYEANSRLVSVLNQLTQDLIDMLRV